MAATPERRPSGATVLLLAHVGMIAFSTSALVTFLDPKRPMPAFLAQEPKLTIYRWAWAISGPTYVVLGALAALLHLRAHVGARRALALLGLATGVALAAELLGTSTQLPFGEYHYTPMLGYRILGLVPFPIPISWFYMLVGSLTMAGRLLPAADDGATRWRWALVAGVILLAWDVSMDPSMVKTRHWVWGEGARFKDAGLPGPLVAFFTADAFYGMPLSNWFGWLLVGTLIGRLMLAVVPPTEVAARLAPTWLPIALYAANGVMPVALCLRDGMPGAAAWGTVAMAIPVGLALVRSRRPVAPVPAGAAR